MKKKLFKSILLGTMLLFAVGCNKEEDNKNDTDKENKQETITVTPEPTPAEEGSPKVKVGETVVFGAYEQDGNMENGAEAVEWLVLEVTDGKALLLSQYGLEAMPYNETEEAMTWEACSLRKWLNGEFYEKTFSAEEKGKIVLTEVLNNKEDNSGVDGGNDTEDNVFLLSVDEAKRYFGEDETGSDGRNYNVKRAAKPTAYAATKPLTIVTNGSWYDGSSPYWLRSPGIAYHIAAVVDYNGDVYDFGHGVSEPKNMVRPAIWVELGQ